MNLLVDVARALKSAVVAIKKAIAAKGVAVPDDAKLTDLPQLVSMIDNEKGYVAEYPVVVKMNDMATCAIKDVGRLFGRTWDSLVLLRTPSDCRSLLEPMYRGPDICTFLNSGSNITDASGMFYGYGGKIYIDSPEFGINIENASCMFYYCSGTMELSAKSVNGDFGARISDASYMFYGTDPKIIETVLLNFPVFGTHITNADQMFWPSDLSDLVLPDGFGFRLKSAQLMFCTCRSIRFNRLFGGHLEDAKDMFSASTGLLHVDIPEGWLIKVSIDFSQCMYLDLASALNIIKALTYRPSDKSPVLTLPYQTAVDKIDENSGITKQDYEAEIAIATNDKHWTVTWV